MGVKCSFWSHTKSTVWLEILKTHSMNRCLDSKNKFISLLILFQYFIGAFSVQYYVAEPFSNCRGIIIFLFFNKSTQWDALKVYNLSLVGLGHESGPLMANYHQQGQASWITSNLHWELSQPLHLCRCSMTAWDIADSCIICTVDKSQACKYSIVCIQAG